MSLRFLIVGLGSMGKRRIRNLIALQERDISGFDIRPDRNREAREKYGIKIVDTREDISSEDFDVLIISTSPEAHGDYIRYALKHKKHFFVEHPANEDGYADIFKAHKQKEYSSVVMAPSCTLRFYRPVKMMKEILLSGKIGKILAYQYHMGQYLPEWHPWEDYREVYFSKKETSACREMLPFELTWLDHLISSRVLTARGIRDKLSHLDMDADDFLSAILVYENTVIGSVTIEVISRKPYRTLRILGEKGTIDWERFDHCVKVYEADGKKTHVIPVPQGNAEQGYLNEEEMYISEVEAFLAAIRKGTAYPFTFEENLTNLRLLTTLTSSHV